MFQLQVRKQRSWYRWSDHRGGDEAFGREVFEDALGRAANPDELIAFGDRVGRVGRKRAALEVFARPQRMFDLAKRLGL